MKRTQKNINDSKKKWLRIPRGILGLAYGSNQFLTITKNQIMYIKKNKN